MPVAVLAHLDDPKWNENAQARQELQEWLVPLCAYYLTRAKRGKEPLDTVARFHLRNGARLERINWLGDTSKAGMDRSAGVTVNYRYRLGDLEHNHELYTRDYQVSASRDVEALAKQAAAGPARPARAR